MAEPPESPGLFETNRAQRTGMRTGLVSAAAAGYLLFVGPQRMFDVAMTAGDLLVVRDVGASPYIGVAIATAVVGFLSGLGYAAIGRARESNYRSDLATGVVIPPATVVVASFVVIVLEPVANRLLAGAVLGALGLLGVEIVALILVLVSWVGQLVAILFFLLYLWLPAHVGTIVGGVVGETGRLVGQTVFPPRGRE